MREAKYRYKHNVGQLAVLYRFLVKFETYKRSLSEIKYISRGFYTVLTASPFILGIRLSENNSLGGS